MVSPIFLFLPTCQSESCRTRISQTALYSYLHIALLPKLVRIVIHRKFYFFLVLPLLKLFYLLNIKMFTKTSVSILLQFYLYFTSTISLSSFYLLPATESRLEFQGTDIFLPARERNAPKLGA